MSKGGEGLDTYLIEWVGLDLRELVFHVVRVHGANLLTGRSSEDFDNLNELVNARFAREEGLSEHQFCHDAASGPNVCCTISK